MKGELRELARMADGQQFAGRRSFNLSRVRLQAKASAFALLRRDRVSPPAVAGSATAVQIHRRLAGPANKYLRKTKKDQSNFMSATPENRGRGCGGNCEASPLDSTEFHQSPPKSTNLQFNKMRWNLLRCNGFEPNFVNLCPETKNKKLCEAASVFAKAMTGQAKQPN